VLQSYNKYATITARALRASLKEEERVLAEKRGITSTRFQKWENGTGGQQVRSIGFNFLTLEPTKLFLQTLVKEAESK